MKKMYRIIERYMNRQTHAKIRDRVREIKKID
jgi:hypothetical protein